MVPPGMVGSHASPVQSIAIYIYMYGIVEIPGERQLGKLNMGNPH
jgi:hypothetical protein